MIMPGTGTLINVACIIAGGLAGMLFGRFIREDIQKSVNAATGVACGFIGLHGAVSKALEIKDNVAMIVVLSITLGAVIGELINIESYFERFGEWLKVKTGNSRDSQFVNAFLTASLTVSIGAMAIIGSIQDGILRDYTTLATKGVLDFIIVMMMTASMGKGAIFSAIPVGVFQGTMTLLAALIAPIMSEAALNNISMVGSILVACVGINLIWGRIIRVGNLLPALVIAVIISMIL